VAVLATLGLGLGACNSAGAPTAQETRSTIPADPKQALTASTRELQKGNYTFSHANHEQTVKGAMHLPSRSMGASTTMTGEEKGNVDVRYVDPDGYVKIKVNSLSEFDEAGDLDELAADPETAKLAESIKQMKLMLSGEKWLHVDPAKIRNKDDFTLGLENPDMTGSGHLMAAVVTAQKTAEREYAGTLDATKVATLDTPFDGEILKAIGDKAKALPFKASLDEQGRLVKLVLDVPAGGKIPAHQQTTEITGYGTATAQQKPAAAEVMEMPEDSYDMFNR
jgi:hypothetical protein